MKNYPYPDISNEEKIFNEKLLIAKMLLKSSRLQHKIINCQKEINAEYNSLLNNQTDNSKVKAEKILCLIKEMINNMSILVKMILQELAQVQAQNMPDKENKIRLINGVLVLFEQKIAGLHSKREKVLNSLESRKKLNVEPDQKARNEIRAEIERIKMVFEKSTALQNKTTDYQEKINAEYNSLFHGKINNFNQVKKLHNLAVERLNNMMIQAQIVSDQVQAIEDEKKVTIKNFALIQTQNMPNEANNISGIKTHLDFLEKQSVIFRNQREILLSQANDQKKIVVDWAKKSEKFQQHQLQMQREVSIFGMRFGVITTKINNQVQCRTTGQTVRQQRINRVPQPQTQPQQQQMQQTMLREGVAGKSGLHLGQVQGQVQQQGQMFSQGQQSQFQQQIQMPGQVQGAQLQKQTQSQTTANQLNNSKPSSTLFQNRSQIRSRSK